MVSVKLGKVVTNVHVILGAICYIKDKSPIFYRSDSFCQFSGLNDR